VRIVNIDAPELPGSPRCAPPRRPGAWCDFARGAAARDALTRLLGSGVVTIERFGRDGYGRTLARVRVDGIDAGEWLIARGLARRWR
jgi:endonuclease YncB( thermonuclease family)